MYFFLPDLLFLLTTVYPEILTRPTKWTGDLQDEMKTVVGDMIQKGGISPAALTLWR